MSTYFILGSSERNLHESIDIYLIQDNSILNETQVLQMEKLFLPNVVSFELHILRSKFLQFLNFSK